jgi:integrase
MAKKYRLIEWADRYKIIVGARELSVSTRQEKYRGADTLCRLIGDKKLKKINPSHIALAIRAVWETGQRSRARRLLMIARDMFGEAAINGHININPALHVKPLSCRVRRARLSLEDWRRTQKILAAEKTPWKRWLAPLALITGQRRGDLARMRFDDIWRDRLHIVQEKTGERIALPLDLRLDAIGISLREIIDACRDCAPVGEMLLRKTTGEPLSVSSLTKTFATAFRHAVKWGRDDKTAPSLQECRSLSERLYSAQGIDTQTLLGHRRPGTTALYHDDRGLYREEGRWRALRLPKKRQTGKGAV